MSLPAHSRRLAAELPPDACREILARIEEARRLGESALIQLLIEVDAAGRVHLLVPTRYGWRGVPRT